MARYARDAGHSAIDYEVADEMLRNLNAKTHSAVSG